ncbi:MAG: VPLPA-CTERM sorting domain-containing protein [Gammaproteobacteria bacterium]
MSTHFATRLLLAAVAVLLAFAATAAPIQYKFTGTAYGSLDGASFAQTDFELTLLAETTQTWIWSGSTPGYPIYHVLSHAGDAILSLDGVGDVIFAQDLLMTAQSGDIYGCMHCIGILDPKVVGNPYIWLVDNPGFDGYDLTTSIQGPNANTWATSTFGVPLLTQSGPLEINTFNETFSATLIPLPAAFWLFGSALGAVGWIRRRRAMS